MYHEQVQIIENELLSAGLCKKRSVANSLARKWVRSAVDDF